MTRDPASAQGVTDRVEVSPPDIAWSLDAEAPALAAALAATSPWVRAAYDGLRDRMVVARTCRAFDAGRIFRPAGHYRAIYMRGPDEQGGVQDDGVLAIKGTELFATDLEAMIASIKQTRHPHADKKHSNLEHFPIIEQKVPMALLVEEGLAEARQAQRFQAAHLERYGELAAAPIPLLVIRWPDPVVAAFRDALVPALSERAAELVALRMAGGLGVYVYYYRNPPLRALHLDAALESKVGAHDGYRGRLAALEQRVEPRQVVADWVALVARMLALGFMPCTRASHETGQCLRSMNAVVDGGFVDLDSMQPLSALASEEELVETLLVSLKELSETVATFVLGSALPRSNLGPSPALVSHAVFALVRDELRAAMEEEARRGAVFDPRLEGVLGRRDLFSGIDHVLAALYPAAPRAAN
jgi:hypothetical protein